MNYPFTTEQLLELIEFVARAIMLQVHPSGDDSIIGRQASRGLASLTQNCLLTHWGSLFPSEPFAPAGPARLISAAYPISEDVPVPKEMHVSHPVPENPIVLSAVGIADKLMPGWRYRGGWHPCFSRGSLLCASFEGRRPPKHWEDRQQVKVDAHSRGTSE